MSMPPPWTHTPSWTYYGIVHKNFDCWLTNKRYTEYNLLLLGVGGGRYLRRGSLLSGFTSSHKKLTLISGGCYFRGVVTIGTLWYHDYVLIDWVGGPDGKIFGPRSWRTDRAQRGPCAMNDGQIFSHPARPNSVNKHFIIWPPRFSFFFFLFFSSFRVIKSVMFTYGALFDRKVGIYMATKLF